MTKSDNVWTAIAAIRKLLRHVLDMTKISEQLINN